VDKVKSALETLLNIYILSILRDNNINTYSQYDTLDIVIAYNYDEYYIVEDKKSGYSPLPMDYIKILLPTLDPVQWSIYTALVSHYNYYYPYSTVDNNTGEIVYNYTINNYAYPTQEKLGEKLNIPQSTIRYHLPGLLSNKYTPVTLLSDEVNTYRTHSKKSKKEVIKKENLKYKVTILERFEYIYHYILTMQEMREQEFLDKLNKHGFDKIACSNDQKALNDKDYMLTFYTDICKKIINAYENNSKEWYEQWKQRLSTSNFLIFR
jgi:hypothetical protein